MSGYVGGIYAAGGCIETLTQIGQLEARYEGVVVDAVNGQLWATQDGYLFQFTYPGLVNTQGPGVPYYDDSANNLSTGAPALDDLGNVYYVDANVTGGEHQTLYKVQSGGSRTTINTRSGHHPILDLCWSRDDGTGTPALFGAEQINPGDLYRIDSSSWALVDSTTVPANTGSSPPVATADGAVWRIIQIPGEGRVAIRYRNSFTYEYHETATHQYDVTFPLALCSGRIVWRGDDLDGTWQLFSAIYPDEFSGDPQPYDNDALKALLALYGDGWQAFPTPATCKVAYLAFPDEGFTTAIYERTCCGSTRTAVEPPSTEFFHPFSGVTWDAPEGTPLHYEYNLGFEWDPGLTGTFWFALYVSTAADEFAQVLVMDGPHATTGTVNISSAGGTYIIAADAIGVQPGILYVGPDSDFANHPLPTISGFSGFFATI